MDDSVVKSLWECGGRQCRSPNIQQEKDAISYSEESLYQNIAIDASVNKLYLAATLSDNIGSLTMGVADGLDLRRLIQ